MIYVNHLDTFKSIMEDSPKDVEKFPDLINAAVTNLK